MVETSSRWGSRKSLRDNVRPASRVLTAAGMRINLTERPEVQRLRSVRQNWQLDAYVYRNTIGELRYAVELLANSASRMRMFIAVLPDGGETDVPVPLADMPGVPPDLIAAANQAMSDLGNGRMSMAQHNHAMSTNLSLAGEAMLLGREDLATGDVNWTVRSVSEIVVYDDQVMLREGPLDSTGALGLIPLPSETTYVSRMWKADPQFKILADSPMRAILNECEALLILRRGIRAVGRSRLAGRGLLLWPNELSLNGQNDDNADPESNPVINDLAEAMMTPITQEGDASAVVPVLVQGPAEYLKEVRLVELSASFDELSSKIREELVGVIATGLDLPKEAVLGLSDLNHWSAWNVDDNMFRHHLEPHVITISDAWTAGYVRPYLETCGLDAQIVQQWLPRVVMWYDPTELVTHPDQTANALQAYDRNAISHGALRRVMGFSDADAPDNSEIIARLIQNQRSWPANVSLSVLHDLDPTLVVPAITESGTVPGIKAGVGAYVPDPVALPGAPPPADSATPVTTTTSAPPPASSDTPPGPPANGLTAAGRATASKTAQRLSRELGNIDTDLRSRLIVAANAAMLRQLEKAGTRLRMKVANNDELRTKIAHSRAEHVAALLGEDVVTASGLTAAGLLQSSWDTLKDQYMNWTEDAQKRAVTAAARLANLDVTAATGAADAAMRQGRERGWTVLRDAMDALAIHLPFSDNPLESEAAVIERLNPDTLVPAGLIRATVAVAGGAQPSEFGIIRDKSGAEVRAQPLGIPVGGIGTGANISSLLTDAGAQSQGFEWVHGPSTKPFEPHEALNGTEFESFTDDALANTEGFPDNAYFFPGDHLGSVVPGTIIDGSLAQALSLRWYEGEVVDLTTASGKFLTVTANHPVLTDRGWVAANLLVEGDNVIRSVDTQRAARLAPNEYQIPTAVEELFAASWMTPSMIARCVPVAAEDFHGDGVAGQVAVVTTDGDLGRHVKAAFDQPTTELRLVDARDIAKSLASASRPFEGLVAVGASSFGVEGEGRKTVTLVGGSTGAEQELRIASASWSDAESPESLGDRVAVHAESLGQSLDGLAGFVEFDQVTVVNLRGGFSGHVFDLHTREQWYVANGILLHNCLCDVNPQWIGPEDVANARAIADQQDALASV